MDERNKSWLAEELIFCFWRRGWLDQAFQIEEPVQYLRIVKTSKLAMGWNNPKPALMKEIRAVSQKNKFFVLWRKGWLEKAFQIEKQSKAFWDLGWI